MEATHWGRWARQLPFSSAVPVLVAPPVVGGIVVGTLRALTRFDDPTASQEAQKGTSSQQAGAAPVMVCGAVNLSGNNLVQVQICNLS